MLTGASAGEFAAGILSAMTNPAAAAAVGRRARELAETKYSYQAYLGPDAPRLRAAGGVMSPDHYSYTVYADPSTARTFDDRRFGGPIGELVAETQAAVILRMAGDGRRPAGAGRRDGYRARGAPAGEGRRRRSPASTRPNKCWRSRVSARGLTAAPINFVQRDAHALTFADRSFDVAVSLRVLMHSPRWRDALAELCRVASRRVIFDYPSARSAALLQSAFRRADGPRRSQDRAVSRLLRPRHRPPRSTRAVSASRTGTGSSCCRSRCTRPSGRAR